MEQQELSIGTYFTFNRLVVGFIITDDTGKEYAEGYEIGANEQEYKYLKLGKERSFGPQDGFIVTKRRKLGTEVVIVAEHIHEKGCEINFRHVLNPHIRKKSKVNLLPLLEIWKI